MRILWAVHLLHNRVCHAIRVSLGMSVSGSYWRVSLSAASDVAGEDENLYLGNDNRELFCTTGNTVHSGLGEVTFASRIADIAELILKLMPKLNETADNPNYVRWNAGPLDLREQHEAIPMAYSDAWYPS